MEKIIFSQSGVYRLQQLASQVRSITGIRHRLSDESAMIELLRSSASSKHQVIQTYLAAFTSELDEQQKSSLFGEPLNRSRTSLRSLQVGSAQALR